MTSARDLIDSLTAHLEVDGDEIRWACDGHDYDLTWDTATGLFGQSIEATIWDGQKQVVTVHITFEVLS